MSDSKPFVVTLVLPLSKGGELGTMNHDITPHARREPADQAGSFFTLKPALTYSEQADRMVQRGLSLEGYGRTAVEKVLSEVNYYRLRGYWMTFEEDGFFIPGTAFRDVMDIYDFDCSLRSVTGSLCERVEIKFRTSFGARHDTFETKDGKEIQVPRHAKDLSSGVERDIKEKLGMR
ncbi:MAG: Abi family protein [Olsenella sp.]